jgi:hypothetical protein
MKEDDDLSANIKEYLENSPFQVRNPPPSTSSTSAHGTLD